MLAWVAVLAMAMAAADSIDNLFTVYSFFDALAQRRAVKRGVPFTVDKLTNQNIKI